MAGAATAGRLPIRASRLTASLLGLTLCAAILAAWFAGRPDLVQLHPDWPAVQFNLALSLALLHMAMLARPLPWLRTLLIAPVFVIGLLTLLQYLLFVDTGIDRLLLDVDATPLTSHRGRMAPTAAFGLMFISVAALVGIWSRGRSIRDLGRWAACCFALLLAGVHLIAYASGMPGLLGSEQFTQMGLLAAISFLLIGIALLPDTLPRDQPPVERQKQIALTLAIALVFCSLLTWLYASTRDSAIIAEQTDFASQRVALTVQAEHQRRVDRIRSLADAVVPHVLAGDLEALNFAGRMIIDDSPSVDGLAFLDPEFRILAMQVRDQDLAYRAGQTVVIDTPRERLFRDALTSREPRISEVVQFSGGDPGVLIATPIVHDDQVIGLIVGAGALEVFAAQLFRSVSDDFVVAVLVDGEEVYRYPEGSEHAAAWVADVRTGDVMGHQWHLAVWPTKAYIDRAINPLIRSMLLLAFIVASLIYAALHIAIVSRERAERLAQSERQMATAGTIARVGYWGLDLETKTITWSDEVYRIFGVNRESFDPSRTNFMTFIPEHLHGPLNEELRHTVRTGQPFLAEHEVILHDGSHHHVRSHARLTRDDYGRPTRLDGSVQDIDAEVAQAGKIRRNAERMVEIAALAEFVLSTNDLDAALDRITGQARLIIGAHMAAMSLNFGPDRHSQGVPGRQIFKKSLSDRYARYRHFDVMPDGRGIYCQVCTQNEPLRLTQEALEAHPGWRGFSQYAAVHPPLRGLLAVPLVRRNGENIGLLQLSDRFEGEFDENDQSLLVQIASMAAVAVENFELLEAVRALNTDLEHRVQLRTRELEEANRELETFAYSVSHDLRAPLRAISGFTRILEQGYADRLDDQARHYLGRVTGGVERMSQLIDALLQLSRVSRHELSSHEVRLDELAHAAFERLSEMEPGRRVEWVVDTPMPVRGDRTLLTTLVDNLVGNAWKYTALRDPAEIHFGRLTTDAQTVYYVRDNGVGFDMRHADKLFGVFERLHTDDAYPGTGIGLATVKRVVERHGGRVWAQAEPDQGAEFFFVLGDPVMNPRHGEPGDAVAAVR